MEDRPLPIVDLTSAHLELKVSRGSSCEGGGNDAIDARVLGAERNAGVQIAAAVIVGRELSAGSVFEPQIGIELRAGHVDDVRMPFFQVHGEDLGEASGADRVFVVPWHEA